MMITKLLPKHPVSVSEPQWPATIGSRLAGVRGVVLATSFLTAALIAGCAQTVDTPVSCSNQAESSTAAARCDAAPGAIVEVRLQELRPTQPSLGYDEVHYRLGRFQFGKDKVNKRFDDWCESSGLKGAAQANANSRLDEPGSFSCIMVPGTETAASKEAMKTVVIGPRGRAYLTDGHHTLTSFMEARDGGAATRVRLLVQGNLSGLSDTQFWDEMAKRQWVWLQDAQGRRIAPAALPQSLGLKSFGDDTARSMLYFARDVGYSQKADNATFLEFYWGRWLTQSSGVQIAKEDTATLPNYLALVRRIAQAQVALPDNAPVAEGKVAKSVGKLASFGEREFDKLSKPMSDEKPGKLAYLFAYREAQAKQ
jgi:hypothetical protein